MKHSEETYANGQIKKEFKDGILTWFFKNGKIKAQGPLVDGKMEGSWTFYRETGQLWQTGSLKKDLKHGEWIRYDREGAIEYRETFLEGKQQK